MRNFWVLTGFLIGASVAVILTGQQMVAAYEDAIHSELEANLLSAKADQEAGIKARTAELVLTGDVMLSRAVGAKMAQASDFKFPFLNIAGALRTADVLFGNLEGPISNSGKNQGSKYSFRADPGVVAGLSFAGYDVLSLANNHMFDYGQTALEDTLKILRENNILPIGAGENNQIANEMVVKDVNHNKLGFLAYTNLYPKSFNAGENSAGMSEFNKAKILEKLKQAKANGAADIILVSMHWGDEYSGEPSEAQKKFARELIDAGADIVVGHHPHVTQPVEKYNGGLIFYSLGNFIFDQNFSDETMSGYFAKIKCIAGKIKGWELVGTRINSDFQVEPAGSLGYNSY